MPEFLLELGCEELPASFVRKAYTDLEASIRLVLSSAGMLQAEGWSMGTPRRLIICFPKVTERQEDSVKEQRGPALKAAYGSDGEPSQALLGFCRSQGVDVADLRKDDQYVWVSKKVEGRTASQVLAESLPEAIRRMSFEKSMRWGSGRMRFARPIRWILALLDGDVVPFEVEGVASGDLSRGHRFYAAESFSVRSAQDLIDSLRDRFVEPDAQLRRDLIIQNARAVAEGIPEMTEDLIEENVFLTEWPMAIQGSYRSDFRSLPDPVLITAMAKHEKMFPVRDQDGQLTNRFVFTRNAGEDDTVRRGAEWVLNARFNDAKFFFDEDKKVRLTDFLEKTATIVFQEKLGTVRSRADRLSKLASVIAAATGASTEDIARAKNAALFAKADLATGLVTELSSLQGIIGAEYADREGFDPVVVHAIRRQYSLDWLSLADRSEDLTAARLVLADQLDKLVGYLGLGLEPSGSSDPFGLRRAVTVLIDIAWAWPGSIPDYASYLDQAAKLYAGQGIALDSEGLKCALNEIFKGRYSAMLDVGHDILDAALSAESARATNPRQIRFRTDAIKSIAESTPLVQACTRPLNIIASADKKGVSFAKVSAMDQVLERDLDSIEATELLAVVRGGASLMQDASLSEDSARLAIGIKALEEPINRFFESTMVMAEDERIRFARLSLMQACCDQIQLAGDLSKLVIEG